MALPVRRTTEHHVETRPERTGWDPFGDLERVHRQLASFLDEWRPVVGGLGGNGFTPLADVEELDDAFVVEVELPGVKREDIDIEISGRRLTVSGERKEKERVGMLRRRERTVGRFHHEVVVPDDVDEAGVEAHLDEGVLTVRLPKPEHARARKIAIR